MARILASREMTDLLVRFKQLRKEVLYEAMLHLVDVQSHATLLGAASQFCQMVQEWA